MEQQTSEVSPHQTEGRSVEGSLKALWEAARRAGELIAQLRGENRVLSTKAEELQREVTQLQQELVKKDQIISKLSAEQAGAQSKRAVHFADGERELLASKVRDLLAKIESYL